jgi:hypothetical protein
MSYIASLFRVSSTCSHSAISSSGKMFSPKMALSGMRHVHSLCSKTLTYSLKSQQTYSNMVGCTSRLFASKAETQEDIMNVFDRSAKRKQRNRTAFLNDYAVYDYIKDEVSWHWSAAVVNDTLFH